MGADAYQYIPLYQAGSGELRRGLDDEELLESRELKELLHRLTERGEGNAATRRAKVSESGKKDPESGTADIGQLRAVEDNAVILLAREKMQTLLQQGTGRDIQATMELEDRNFSN